MKHTLYKGDCLEVMKDIKDKSVRMVACDLPYGETQNYWDHIIDMDKLWEEYDRIIVENGIIILTCSLKFAITIINSKPKKYKYYDIVWNKISTTGFLNAKRQPLRQHEFVLCFYKKQPLYKPIMEVRGKPRNKGSYNKKNGTGDMCYGKFENVSSFNNEYYPTSVLNISNANQKDKLHPTQKPVALLEYLINTYSNENDLILDNCMGSNSTGIACMNTNRNYIGIEKDDTYFDLAIDRTKKHIEDNNIECELEIIK